MRALLNWGREKVRDRRWALSGTRDESCHAPLSVAGFGSESNRATLERRKSDAPLTGSIRFFYPACAERSLRQFRSPTSISTTIRSHCEGTCPERFGFGPVRRRQEPRYVRASNKHGVQQLMAARMSHSATAETGNRERRTPSVDRLRLRHSPTKGSLTSGTRQKYFRKLWAIAATHVHLHAIRRTFEDIAQESRIGGDLRRLLPHHAATDRAMFVINAQHHSNHQNYGGINGPLHVRRSGHAEFQKVKRDE